MVGRIARILSAGVVMMLLANVQPATCDGWSLPNPFSAEAKNNTKKKTRITKVSQKEPSFFDKINAGAKNFFDKTGETLGLKKPEPQKPRYANPKPHPTNVTKKAESKSWLNSLAPYDEEKPKKPKNVTDWMGQPRQDL